MKKIEEILHDRLDLETSNLIGCRRRNLWTEDDQSWRHIRGNALLAVLGDKRIIHTPVGPLEFFILHDRWLLQFRGGQWNHYWMEDFMDLWSLVSRFGTLDLLSPMVYVLHENKGDLSIREVVMPDYLDPTSRSSEIIADLESDPPGRFPKSGPRAMRVCRYCPLRTECNATDELHDQTQDWSPSYRSDLR